MLTGFAGAIGPARAALRHAGQIARLHCLPLPSPGDRARLRDDLDSLTASRDFSRRDVVRTSVGSGFAAAVLPEAAQTLVKTDTTGLLAGEISIPMGDFKLPAYRAAPAGVANAPVVLVVSEIVGVHEHIADVARRFAKAGYFAIAQELFVRQGADTGRTGITGFCWGGRITWLYAAHNPVVKAGVAWYGRLVGAPSALNPAQPVDVAGQLNGPVLGLYGGQDTGIALDTVDKMEAALAAGPAAAKRSEFVFDPDAPHAFHADDRPCCCKDAADDGWKRCLAWFKANGVG